jgi:preprotein translocase subunit SecG
MLILLIFIHVIICIGLILVILIQTNKGGLDANFGGIASNALGTQGATEFVKTWTKILFVAFIISCILLAATVRGNDGTGSRRRANMLQREAAREQEQAIPAGVFPFEEMNESIQLHIEPQQENEYD